MQSLQNTQDVHGTDIAALRLQKCLQTTGSSVDSSKNNNWLIM